MVEKIKQRRRREEYQSDQYCQDRNFITISPISRLSLVSSKESFTSNLSGRTQDDAS